MEGLGDHHDLLADHFAEKPKVSDACDLSCTMWIHYKAYFEWAKRGTRQSKIAGAVSAFTSFMTVVNAADTSRKLLLAMSW